MTRIVTIAIVLLTAGASFGLYQLSYEVQRQEDELSELNRAITQDRENMLVLQAEWSYLTRPENLQGRAARLLELQPMTPRQVVNTSELPTLQERVRVNSDVPAMVSARPSRGARPSTGMAPIATSGQASATLGLAVQ